MKFVQKYSVLSLFLALGLMFAGCGEAGSTDGGSSDTTEESSEGSGSSEESSEGSDNASTTEVSGEFQTVSLNVPNMTWAGCAASVRSALAEVDGVDADSIETSTGDRLVSFKAKSGLDLDAALAAHKDNAHLKDWSKAEN